MRPRFTHGLAVFLFASLLAGCNPSNPQLKPVAELRRVLAAEAAPVAGASKSVVLIVPHWAVGSSVEKSFTDALKKQGVKVSAVILADTGNPMQGSIGLKSADFFAALEKASGNGAVVSLAGAPLLAADEVARAQTKQIPVLVVATASLGDVIGIWGNPGRLARLLKAKVIDLAIVDGPAPVAMAVASQTSKEFARNYHVLKPTD